MTLGSTLFIRVMTLGDYDAVHALWQSTPGMGLRDIDDSREGIGRFLRRNPRTNVIALAGGELVGVVLAGHDGRRAHLYHAAVREDCQGRGIGSLLVASVMDALESEGIYKACLVAFGANTNGNRFWEKQGFTVRGDLVYRDKVVIPQ